MIEEPDGYKAIIDDRRDITAWTPEPGKTNFVFQNGMGQTRIQLTDEAVHAMVALFVKLQKDLVVAEGPVE